MAESHRTFTGLGGPRSRTVNRDEALDRLGPRRRPYDIIVIGGGATGAGIALDAASRKLDVLLLEARDFGAGTSSRSTKIIHGGVRYLAQGRIGLVREALRERGYLLRNAPHLVQPLAFVVPVENAWEKIRYYTGLNLYDLLSGRDRLDRCTWLPRAGIARTVAGVKPGKLKGAMRYCDAQFDDTRLLINILDTAVTYGATVLNYAEVVELGKDSAGMLRTVTFRDSETGGVHEVAARAVINATGADSDDILQLDDRSLDKTIMPSQGAHIVVDRKFLPGNSALLMPHTPDGRIMFAIPWLGHVLIGTTDTAITDSASELQPLPAEIEMILKVAGRYLARQPKQTDILSMFAGIRPLVRSHSAATTAQASREHRIEILPSGLISISGGKWTTYRLMAEQCVDVAAKRAQLNVPASATASLRLRASPQADITPAHYQAYGEDAAAVAMIEQDRPGTGEYLHAALPYRLSECVWAIRREMARNVEDVLARRTRALFLNARAAIDMAPAVAAALARELKLDEATVKAQLASFNKLAKRYYFEHYDTGKSHGKTETI